MTHKSISVTFSFLLPYFLLILTGCQLLRPAGIQRDIQRIIKRSAVFNSYFVGIYMVDPKTGQTLASYNADKYFTPASNTKIATYHTALSYLSDSTVSFYQNPENPAQFIAMGDGTFLHSDFPTHPAYQKLKNGTEDSLLVFIPDFKVEKWGTGWGWDDYAYDYQAERNLVPINGNCAQFVTADTSWYTIPSFFKPFVQLNHTTTDRSPDYNFFYLPHTDSVRSNEPIFIPYKTSNELAKKLLEDTLGKKINVAVISDWKQKMKSWTPIYNQKMSELLAIMMQRSDNFYAEQLLIQSALFSGASSLDAFIESTSKNMYFLPQPIYWYDGSGLSRYNLFSPASIAAILTNLYAHNSWETLAQTFPVGGLSGTIKNWYGAETPYVFAKTGTLKNNHCLSGYLITKSGKTLIFSLMHNHYTDSTTVIRSEMQKLLEQIRDSY